MIVLNVFLMFFLNVFVFCFIYFLYKQYIKSKHNTQQIPKNTTTNTKKMLNKQTNIKSNH